MENAIGPTECKGDNKRHMISTGTKIKHIRQYRKLTMKALGASMGFDEKSAAVRIAQWEQGSRNPGSESIAHLSQALDILPDRLLHKAENPVSGFIEYIIWSELSGSYGLDLDFARLSAFMGEFLVRRAKCQSGEISNEDYIEWLLHFCEGNPAR